MSFDNVLWHLRLAMFVADGFDTALGSFSGAHIRESRPGPTPNESVY